VLFYGAPDSRVTYPLNKFQIHPYRLMQLLQFDGPVTSTHSVAVTFRKSNRKGATSVYSKDVSSVSFLEKPPKKT
jgi:hypothetical protein